MRGTISGLVMLGVALAGCGSSGESTTHVATTTTAAPVDRGAATLACQRVRSAREVSTITAPSSAQMVEVVDALRKTGDPKLDGFASQMLGAQNTLALSTAVIDAGRYCATAGYGPAFPGD